MQIAIFFSVSLRRFLALFLLSFDYQWFAEGLKIAQIWSEEEFCFKYANLERGFVKLDEAN